MEILPHELRLAIFADLPPRDQRECRAVCKTWKEDIDEKWCRVMPKIDETRKFEILYSFVTVPPAYSLMHDINRDSYDHWTSERATFMDGFHPERVRSPRLPSFADTRRDPQFTFEQQRQQLPFFSSLPAVLALAADPSGTSLTLQGERIAIDYTNLAARYVRGWAEVSRSVTGGFWDLSPDICAWLSYVLPSEGMKANLLTLAPRKRRLALTTGNMQGRRTDWIQGMVTELVTHLVSNHVREALSISVASPQDCLLQVSAALALPVRVLAECRRAEGNSRSDVAQLEETARMTVSSYLIQVAGPPPGGEIKSFPLAVRALLDRSVTNQKIVMQMFDRILAS